MKHKIVYNAKTKDGHVEIIDVIIDGATQSDEDAERLAWEKLERRVGKDGVTLYNNITQVSSEAAV